MGKLLKKKRTIFINKLFIAACLFMSVVVPANSARAAEYSASLETDRAGGVCTYTVNGIDTTIIKEMTLKVTYNDGQGNTGEDNINDPGATSAPAGTAGPDATDVPENTPVPDNTQSPASGDNGLSNGETGITATGNRGDGINSTEVTALEQKITLNETNCTNGTSTGTFSLDSLDNYLFKDYNVSFIMGEPAEGTEPQTVDAGKCDFSIHSE